MRMIVKMTIMRTSLLSLLVIVGCSSGNRPSDPRIIHAYSDKPSANLIEKIENRLAREPCIGSLSRWSRHYSYAVHRGLLAKQAVSISLEEPGFGGRPPGLSIDLPGIYKNLDTGQVYAIIDIDGGVRKLNRNFRSVSGEYDTINKSIVLWDCRKQDIIPDKSGRFTELILEM